MNAFGEDLVNVKKFYDLGLRTANFTYNQDNAYGGGSVSNEDESNDGVTDLGKQFIREMNRVEMVVDCSHSSNQTCIDAATLTSKPMVMSHSNSAAFQPIGRNVTDEAIQAVAATGGAICVNFIGGFLNPQGEARPMDIAKHIQYVRSLAGIRLPPVLFDEGKDITYLLDLASARRPNQEQKRVNVDFPLWMVNRLDDEARRIGVTRQSIIKIWLAERLEKIRTRASS